MPSSIFLPTTILFLISVLFGSLFAEDTFAVFKSNNRGQSWTRTDSGLPPNSRINAFGSTKTTLFAGTDSGIFRSKDEAKSWQHIPITNSAAVRILSFATAGENVYAGTDGSGILKSADGGNTWEQDRSFPSKKVRCMRRLGETLFAGTDRDGVFVIKAGSQSWVQQSAGLPARAQAFALSAVREKLFVGLYTQGIYSWNKSKKSWEKLDPVTPLALASVKDTIIAGHNPGGIYWSADLGVSWHKSIEQGTGFGALGLISPGPLGELTPEAPVWEMGANDDVAFAGAANGIYFSNDQGRTWKRSRQGLPEKSPGIAFLVQSNFVLVGTQIQ